MEKKCKKAWRKKWVTIEGKRYKVDYLVCRDIKCIKLLTCQRIEAISERVCNSVVGVVNKVVNKTRGN